MEVKRGYQQTKVGVIPDDWEVRKLGELGEPIIGLTYKPENIRKDGLLVLRSSNIGGNRLKYDDNVFVNVKIPPNLYTRLGDILVCVRNGSRQLIGKSAFIDEKATGHTFGAFMSIFRTDYSNFLFHLFTSDILRSQIQNNLGATINQITNKDLKSFFVPFPTNKTEQTTIANALSDADSLINSLEKLIAKKRNIKQGAMQLLFTGNKRLPGFSGQWETKQLEELVTTISSGIYGVENHSGSLVAMPVATTAHISDDDLWNEKAMQVRFFSREQLAAYSVEEGDLVVVKSSGSAASIKSGKIGLVAKDQAGTFVFSNFLMTLRPKAVISEFIYFYLTSHNVKKLLPSLVEASTYPNIRVNEYLAIDIPVPTSEEQTAIAAILSDMNTEIEGLEHKLAKYRLIKQGMMQELLTGKKRLI